MSGDSEVHNVNLVIRAFIIENLVGGSLLIWSLLTALFFPHIRRRSGWISLYTALLLDAVSSLVLFFTNHIRGDPPPQALCLAQATLMYTASFLVAATVFSLSLQVWLSVIKGRDIKDINKWLVTVPWGASLIITTLSCAIGLSDKEGAVRRDSPYCWVVNRVPAYTMQSLSVLSLLTALILQALILRHLWTTRSAPMHSPSAARRIGQDCKPVVTTIRLAIFCTAAMSGIAFCVASFTSAFMDVPYIIQGMWPLMGFLVFGFRMDFLRAWLTCCRRERDDEEDDDHDLDSVVHVYDPTMVDIRLGQYGGHGQPGSAVRMQAHTRDDSRGSRGDAESAVLAIMKPGKAHVPW